MRGEVLLIFEPRSERARGWGVGGGRGFAD